MRLADNPADLTNEPEREAYRYAKVGFRSRLS
jgi:hypothetical protein